jgi:hypothetical protein
MINIIAAVIGAFLVKYFCHVVGEELTGFQSLCVYGLLLLYLEIDDIKELLDQ